MNLRFPFLAAALTAVVSIASAEGLFFEAGGGIATYSGGDYSLSSIVPPSPNASANVVSTDVINENFREDRSAPVFHVAVGYRILDGLSLKVGYHQLGRTTSTQTADVVIGVAQTAAGDITMKYQDRVQAVSFSPEFRLAMTPKLSLTLAPELNWIFSQASLRTETDSPAISIIPFIERKSDKLTLGAALGAEWAATEKLTLSARYQFKDLDNSWDRQAHVFSAGLRFAF